MRDSDPYRLAYVVRHLNIIVPRYEKYRLLVKPRSLDSRERIQDCSLDCQSRSTKQKHKPSSSLPTKTASTVSEKKIAVLRKLCRTFMFTIVPFPHQMEKSGMMSTATMAVNAGCVAVIKRRAMISGLLAAMAA